MATSRQTLGKKLFAGFAAVLLIAMTAIVPTLMDLREILLTLGAQPGHAGGAAAPQSLTAETAQKIAGLAAHAYSYGAVGGFLLVVTSLAIAYVITRAVNLPLLTIWKALSASLRELNGLGDHPQSVEASEAGTESIKAAYANANAAAQRLGSLLGTEDLDQPRQS